MGMTVDSTALISKASQVSPPSPSPVATSGVPETVATALGNKRGADEAHLLLYRALKRTQKKADEFSVVARRLETEVQDNVSELNTTRTVLGAREVQLAAAEAGLAAAEAGLAAASAGLAEARANQLSYETATGVAAALQGDCIICQASLLASSATCSGIVILRGCGHPFHAGCLEQTVDVKNKMISTVLKNGGRLECTFSFTCPTCRGGVMGLESECGAISKSVKRTLALEKKFRMGVNVPAGTAIDATKMCVCTDPRCRRVYSRERPCGEESATDLLCTACIEKQVVSATPQWHELGHVVMCDSCETPIERMGNCSQMKCTNCSHDFCWVCMGTFDRWLTLPGSSGPVQTVPYCFPNDARRLNKNGHLMRFGKCGCKERVALEASMQLGRNVRLNHCIAPARQGLPFVEGLGILKGMRPFTTQGAVSDDAAAAALVPIYVA
jgi:hypothetical protein